MEEIVLKWLKINEMKVLKQIIIISDRKNGETELGSILYTRPLTENYNFKKQQEEDEKEKDSDSWSRLLQEYSKQKNYPNDRIDEIILEAVKSSYPKSIVRNDSILFNVDSEKIDVFKNRMVIPATIYFSPEFTHVGNFYDFVGKEFRAPKANVNVYSFFKPEFLEGHIFYASYNASEENVLEDLKTVEFK
ncbi:hypothetical protein AB9P05_00940 [Roseivirga sp. BDSF3-8]|uniref:hypothetical protein n=1 Tax=Roseivirga sp. BDSF3-8 TaxID=3241598 RepID=UPI0035324BC4